MEGNGIGPNSSSRPVIEKKGRPQEQLNCPRCNSTNTKFCYYNNYSLTQPRYFCKTCRRYWTEGGSLRNVPVGGGSRKNKSKLITTTSSASATSSTSSKVPVVPDLNPKMQQGGQDLNLAFPHAMSPFQNNGDTSSAAPTNSSLSALELLRSGMASRGLNLMNPSYVPSNLMPNTNNVVINYPSGFPMQEIKPGLGNFSVDGLGNRSSISYDQGVQDNSRTSGRLLFPFGDQVKQLSTAGTAQVDHQHSNIDKEQANSSTGYWTGMIGEGSW